MKPLWIEAQKELKTFRPYNADSVYFVGSIDDVDIGFVGIVPRAKYALNTNLFVKPLFRNKGYGTSLIKYRVEYAKLLNYKHIAANCTDKAASLYTTLGGVAARKFKSCTRMKLNIGD